MSLFLVLTLLAALGGITLALAVFLRGPKSLAINVFSIGMILLSLEAIMVALGFQAKSQEQVRFWQIARFQVNALLPGVWLLFSLSFARGNYREFLILWRSILILAFILPVGVAVGGHTRLVFIEQDFLRDTFIVTLAPAGKILSVFFLLGLVLILMNLERTFRISVGTLRWRIKYFILGLAALLVFRLYETSQAIIYPRIGYQLWQINALALMIATAMISFSLIRSEFASVDLYPSRSILYRSFTLLLVGVYLLVVGVLAKLVSLLGGDAYFSLKAFLVMVALVILAAGLLSDRIHQAVTRFISKHFKGPAHDYLQIWTDFSGKTISTMSETDFSRMVVKWMAENLQILSASIWLLDAHRGHLWLSASTSLPSTDLANPWHSNDFIASLARQLREEPDPVNLAERHESRYDLLKKLNPKQFQSTQQQWCLPLLHHGEPLGFMILGDRVNDLPFVVDDLHLLKCVGNQVAGHLTNIRLYYKLMEVKEFEAFQTMSAFFVHDLKNTATTLSLLLKNFREHFEDPAFREDAFRSLSKSTQHLQELISRLNQLRHELKISPKSADLNDLVKTVVCNLGHTPKIEIVQNLQLLPQCFVDTEQLGKVITNLLLNSIDAIQGEGQITVSTAQRGQWLVLSTSDNGCGMSREFMTQKLFKPFQTTKKTGLGIGMFHSKLIIEAHKGRIEVDSEPGKGTQFRVFLPAGNSP